MPKKAEHKTRERDEKFRLLLVRIPIERNDELEEASKELGLDATKYVRMQALGALNRRKGPVFPHQQYAEAISQP
ncbi:MAG TPA: hypothetical protein DCZ63_08640 [Geobacter sp.]|nr:hypothetical protein [Geobacter sp.]